MRVVQVRQYGGPEMLEMNEAPEPIGGPDDVVVDVITSALNRSDLLQRAGVYRATIPPTAIPGLEFAGRVRRTGSRVEGLAVGDVVMAIVGGGAHAERVAVHARQVVRVPASIPVTNAGAIPEVFMTAWDALIRGGLRPGGAVLIHAGASGVGTAAIQLATAMGARAIATTSTAKVGACEALGAWAVIDYRKRDFVSDVLEMTSGNGVDVILDVVAGGYASRNIDVVAEGGTIVQVGTLSETDQSALSLRQLSARRASIVGTRLRSRPVEEKILLARHFERYVIPWFSGDPPLLHPVIDRRFSLDEIADAHAYMERNVNIGKIVIDVMPTEKAGLADS